jgi:protease I
MNYDLSNKRVAVLATDGFEQIELTSPVEALRNAGAEAVIVSPKSGQIRGWQNDENGWGDSFDVDQTVADASPDDFNALLLPGGVMNPDKLRTDEDVLKFVKLFFAQSKPVAAICHGPWTLVNAGVLQGRKVTSYHTIKMDLVNAGAEWVDQSVVVDEGLVTSRNPDDLPDFNDKLCEEVAEGKHALQHA